MTPNTRPALLPTESFFCGSCGLTTRGDDDGTCLSCGAQMVIVCMTCRCPVRYTESDDHAATHKDKPTIPPELVKAATLNVAYIHSYLADKSRHEDCCPMTWYPEAGCNCMAGYTLQAVDALSIALPLLAEKDAEIARLHGVIGVWVDEVKAHNAEIARLRAALDEADRLLVWARKPAYFCQDCHSHRECEDDACPCSDCFQAQSAAYLARRKE